MDMHTPPPSYESSTGIPAVQPPRPPAKNPFFQSAPPSAPPSYDNDIVPTHVTTPILPQQYQPIVRPTYPIPYPAARPSPQTNAILRNQQSKNNKSMCLCFFITLSVLVVIVIVLVSVATGGSTKSKHSTINKNSNFESEFDKIWREKSQQFSDDAQRAADEMQRRRDESRWDFNSFKHNN